MANHTPSSRLIQCFLHRQKSSGWRYQASYTPIFQRKYRVVHLLRDDSIFGVGVLAGDKQKPQDDTVSLGWEYLQWKIRLLKSLEKFEGEI
jgi:hypothetical protein